MTITNAQLAAMMGRQTTGAERLMDQLYDKRSPKSWDELVDINLLISAREEGMTVANYCRLNKREVPTWALDGEDP